MDKIALNQVPFPLVPGGRGHGSCRLALCEFAGRRGRRFPASSHDFKTYDALKGKAGKDAQAQVKLALWCEAHGMNGERVKHLAQAVLSDPKNVTARGLLGLDRDRQPMGNGGAGPRADQGG